MSKHRNIPARYALTAVVLLPVVLLLLIPLPGSLAVIEAISRLFIGYHAFLRQNVPRISSDAGTWGPGLAAFLLGLVVIQWFGASWARRRRDRSWRVSNTVAVGMLLPLLFAISFLVPGAILQIGALQQVNWFQYSRSDKASKVMHARNIAQAAHAWATMEGDDRFPPSTAAMISWGALDENTFRPQSFGEDLGEPPLYLGAGLTTQSDPDLPLVISDIYGRNQIRHRTIITVGNEFVEIRPEEVDEWIARTMAARDGAKP